MRNLAWVLDGLAHMFEGSWRTRCVWGLVRTPARPLITEQGSPGDMSCVWVLGVSERGDPGSRPAERGGSGESDRGLTRAMHIAGNEAKKSPNPLPNSDVNRTSLAISQHHHSRSFTVASSGV